MAIAARLAFSARRNELRTWTMRIRGLDLTGKAMRMQVRVAPDSPGAPKIDVAAVTSPTVEGLRLVSVTLADGVPVSTVTGRLDASTMSDAAKLPYSGELGEDAQFAFAIQFDGATRLYGPFWALASAIDSDSAPASRPTGPGASGPAPWSSVGLTIAAEDVIEVNIEDTAVTAAYAAAAQAAASEALAASLVARNTFYAQARDVLGPINLVDQAQVTLGSYYNAGTQNDSPDFFNVSVPVMGGTNVVFRQATAAAPFGPSFEDSGGFISNAAPPVPDAPYPTLAGALRMVVNYPSATTVLADLAIYLGDTAPPFFVPHGLNGLMQRLLPHAGEQFGLVGDSISKLGQPENAGALWVGEHCREHRMAKAFVNAVDGSTMQTALTGLTAEIVQGLDQLMLARGTNDFGNARPLGTLGDLASADTFTGNTRLFVETVLGYNDDLRLTIATPSKRTFMAGVGNSYDPSNALGLKLKAYRDVQIALAEEYSCLVNDLYATSGISWINAATVLADGLHPTDQTASWSHGRQTIAHYHRVGRSARARG